MCGILGQIKLKNSANLFGIRNFTDSLSLMDHRGPDANGIFNDNNCLLGHNRLSIQDLNPESHQPFYSKCGNFVIVFNGEIYNFLELREKLVKFGYIFRTNSDTEVLLNAYIEYGTKCLDMLIGMFSFCIHDKLNNEYFIVRDRLGIKPLFYYQNEDEFIFSSEIKSILHLKPEIKFINKVAVSSYLSFRYPILDDTFFEDIFSVPPAHYILIKSNNITFHEYWNASYLFHEQKVDHGEEYYLAKLTELLESSVKYRMISDVPIGCYLSGGVDSSIITAIMSGFSKSPVKTYTIGFSNKGFNEFDYAKIVAKKFNTDHKSILLKPNKYIETLNDLIEKKDSPLSVPNEVPLFLMSKELKKDITVVLSGEGADEIFGGYGRIFRSTWDYERMNSIDNLNLPHIDQIDLARNFFKKYGVKSFSSEIEHFYSIYSYISPSDKKKYLSDEFNMNEFERILLNKFLKYFDELKDDSYSNKILYSFEKIHLLGLLHRVDCSTMSTSVEARVPFVDHRLVEFAFTIPIKYKLKWNHQNSKNDSMTLMSDKISEKYDTPKYILKKAYEHLLPKDILYRKKVGFPVPLNDWFGGDFVDYARGVLLSSKAIERGVFDFNSIENLLDIDKLNSNQGMLIWMLINLELFFKSYKLQLKK